MRIALAQINTTVGDLAGQRGPHGSDGPNRPPAGGAAWSCFPNSPSPATRRATWSKSPASSSAPSSSWSAWPPKPPHSPLALICGYVGAPAAPAGKRATNSAARASSGGHVVFRQTKMLLPTYDVFDEARYFLPAERQSLFDVRRPPRRPHHLRGRLERQAVLGAPPVPPRPGGGTRAGRRRAADQHQRLALPHGQARRCAARSSPPPRAATSCRWST